MLCTHLWISHQEKTSVRFWLGEAPISGTFYAFISVTEALRKLFSPSEQVQKMVLLNTWKTHTFPKWLICAENCAKIEAGDGGYSEWREEKVESQG